MISLILLLAACSGQNGGSRAEELALEIRAEYTAMESCQGSTTITADYGQRVYTYGIDFTWSKAETALVITAPENIAGLTAKIEGENTLLEYDGARVETGPLSPDGLSPVDALPVLLRYAREGFIAECVLEEEQEGVEVLHLICRAPEGAPGSGAEVQLWLDPATHAMLRGEISQDGFMVIRCEFSSFTRGQATAEAPS